MINAKVDRSEGDEDRGPAEPPPIPIIRGEILGEETILPLPCHLCGSDEHGTLCRTVGFGDLQGVEYICPVLSYDCWDRQVHIPGLGLRLCPRRFASAYQYNRYAVVDAFFRFENRGLGKYMSMADLRSFRERVFILCHSDEVCICKEWRV